MGARWTHKGYAYIHKDIRKTHFPSKPLEMLQRKLKRGSSVPKERRTSSHAPLGILNTQDEHEPYQVASRGVLGFLQKRRNIPIEAVRGKRMWFTNALLS
jgi:hypothetical protein